MRVDAAGARTWLLAAVALWAVCVWGLAAFGLGSRIQVLPEDPSLLQPLPADGLEARERLGPLPQYGEIGERPLFAHDRRHRPWFLDPQGDEEAQPDGFDVVLTSVLITPGLEMAIVQPLDGGEAIGFRVGESARDAPGWTLVSVAPRSAVFAGPEGERTMEMRVYDGVGGQPPTPMTRAAEAGPAAREAAQQRRQSRAAAQAQAQARGTAPLPATTPAAAPEQAVGNGAEDITPASQAEAIRRRIEARRAQLRQQRQQQQPNP